MIATFRPSPRPRTGAASRLFLALAGLAAAALAAEVPADVVRTRSSTGLYTLQDGHSAALTVVEAGGRDALPTAVALELLDAADVVIAQRTGVLRPGHPVRLSFESTPPRGLVVRARARLVTSIDNLTSAPILTLEIFNDQTLDSFAVQTCRLKYDPEGTGGKVLGNCGGCETSFETDL